MSFVRYPLIDNRLFLVNLFLRQKKTVPEARKLLGNPPYNCVLNMLKKHLTKDELQRVPKLRQRYSERYKLKCVFVALKTSSRDVSDKTGVSVKLIRAWRKAVFADKPKGIKPLRYIRGLLESSKNY